MKERNFVIQLCVGIFAICFAFVFDIPFIEKIIIIILTTLVLGAEIINTAIEELLDFVSKERRPEIARIKDITAAFVLLFCVSAAIIGFWILFRVFSSFTCFWGYLMYIIK